MLLPRPSMDHIVDFSHDEHARQGFVSALRRHVMVDMGESIRSHYQEDVAPAFEAEHGRPPKNGREVRKQMLDDELYRAYSVLRYNAQEMTWASVQDSVERNLPELVAEAKILREQPVVPGGSLELDPELPIPRYVSAMDVHLMPGCYQSEHVADDVAQGALYDYGTRVFTAGLAHRTRGGVGASIASFLKIRYPDFAPQRILDLGCTVGNNTLPYLDVYPDAEAYGVDVGAPVLRYAYARAQRMGKTAHFSQQNAESMNFADNSMDLVVSSFFLHELSVASTKQIFREAHRVLKPGGLMMHMELPPSSEVDTYYNFWLDWDAYHNNEPHYAAFRNLDFPSVCVETGFDAANYVQFRIPNTGTCPDEVFEACALGKQDISAIGNGASWFIFGAWK